ncbi:hypothetical protein CLOM_g2027 [Closterium sp. NIES-68]|nr:hypothetical protein CLOM_g2027 [Closterium sp. NIES-68]
MPQGGIDMARGEGLWEAGLRELRRRRASRRTLAARGEMRSGCATATPQQSSPGSHSGGGRSGRGRRRDGCCCASRGVTLRCAWQGWGRVSGVWRVAVDAGCSGHLHGQRSEAASVHCSIQQVCRDHGQARLAFITREDNFSPPCILWRYMWQG